MEPSPVRESPTHSAPRFAVIDRQPLRPAAVLLAVLLTAGLLSSIAFGLSRSRAAHQRDGGQRASRPPKAGNHDSTPDDEDDDPSQVDTIVLGDAADAPVPAQPGHRAGNVHATVIVHLPRFGEQVGLIPDTVSGHLLYAWLAAFNQASPAALEAVLPGTAPASTAAAQMMLRQQTGGFNLLSARQLAPGVLVFRLRDQTPLANEVLGTLQVNTNANPPAIASLSLRAVSKSGK